MTARSSFRIGSIAKTFVATVVLQLAAEGRLGLDDSLEQHVPGIVDAGAQITLRQLLIHTSGVPEFFFEVAAVDLQREWTPRELVTLSRRTPIGQRERWAYSNTNYVLLGLVIEAVTATPVERELERRIVQPLGLESTSARRGAAPTARGYLAPSNPFVPSSGSRLVDASEIGSSWAWPALVSSAPDVARFLQGLLGGELLPAEMLEAMLAAVESDWIESDRYGFGIEEISSLMGVSDSPLGSSWGHLGLGLGYTVVALSSRDGRRQTVVMVNQGMIGDDTWRAIGDVAWAALAG